MYLSTKLTLIAVMYSNLCFQPLIFFIESKNCECKISAHLIWAGANDPKIGLFVREFQFSTCSDFIKNQCVTDLQIQKTTKYPSRTPENYRNLTLDSWSATQKTVRHQFLMKSEQAESLSFHTIQANGGKYVGHQTFLDGFQFSPVLFRDKKGKIFSP